jgi:putative exosortase-associated protein (TIGR04073 family)
MPRCLRIRIARRALVGAVLLALLVCLPEVAAAQTAARKAGRGLAGITTCFLEVPGNMVKTTRERGPAWGWTLGFVQGLGMIPVRVLISSYELLSSPFEVPEGFAPIIRPEFPWDYFDASASRRRV